jgi:hypothetical protein
MQKVQMKADILKEALQKSGKAISTTRDGELGGKL